MVEKDERHDETLVLGAGIVGASIAYHLAERGAAVTIVDSIGVAAGATGKSFAWINANHVESEAYHRLRYQSMAEYHRLDRDLGGRLGVSWCGALSFDVDGADFDRDLERFQALGYPAEIISHNRFREMEPCYGAPPDRALHLPLEAALDPAQASEALIDGAVDRGARTLFGSTIRGILRDQNRVIGLETDYGAMEASRVVVAAGVGASAILETADIHLPMADKPGIMLHSKPIAQVINHVIWGDRLHIKQQDDGRLVFGEIFSEGRDDLGSDAIAERMLAEARRLLPDIDIEIDRITIGLRPIPEDGMPIIGPARVVNGLYVAVMHSGVTLAPVIGRMAAEEVLDGTRFEALAPYRPDRFINASEAADVDAGSS